MNHGIQEFFIERARCRRRVSILSAATGAALLLMLSIAGLPFVRDRMDRIAMARFGVRGPERYVELVRVEAQGGLLDPLTDVGRVEPVSRRRGGHGQPAPASTRREKPRPPGPRMNGLGDAENDLVARAFSSAGHVPIFQSNELIIEELVRPEYPEDARQRGIEGKVAVLALVDTLGQVAEAQVMTASGEPELDHAAEVAVLKCRFQPYRERGEVRQVYAIFRFAFRIY